MPTFCICSSSRCIFWCFPIFDQHNVLKKIIPIYNKYRNTVKNLYQLECLVCDFQLILDLDVLFYLVSGLASRCSVRAIMVAYTVFSRAFPGGYWYEIYSHQYSELGVHSQSESTVLRWCARQDCKNICLLFKKKLMPLYLKENVACFLVNQVF